MPGFSVFEFSLFCFDSFLSFPLLELITFSVLVGLPSSLALIEFISSLFVSFSFEFCNKLFKNGILFLLLSSIVTA